MKLFAIFTITLFAACSMTPRLTYSDQDMFGVWCSSRDNGATCWAYGETYPDGTIDSCGREPASGTEFAMTLTSKVDGPLRCETVVKTSHPEVMPVGESFCSRLISKGKDQYTYSFTDDSKLRTTYRRPRSQKWCQAVIDAL